MAQISALQGVTSDAVAAKRARLQEQLNEARETLADTRQQHQFDLESQGYQKLSEDMQKALKDATDLINGNQEALQLTALEMLAQLKTNEVKEEDVIKSILNISNGEIHPDALNAFVDAVNSSAGIINRVSSVYDSLDSTPGNINGILEVNTPTLDSWLATVRTATETGAANTVNAINANGVGLNNKIQSITDQLNVDQNARFSAMQSKLNNIYTTSTNMMNTIDAKAAKTDDVAQVNRYINGDSSQLAKIGTKLDQANQLIKDYKKDAIKQYKAELLSELENIIAQRNKKEEERQSLLKAQFKSLEEQKADELHDYNDDYRYNYKSNLTRYAFDNYAGSNGIVAWNNQVAAEAAIAQQEKYNNDIAAINKKYADQMAKLQEEEKDQTTDIYNDFDTKLKEIKRQLEQIDKNGDIDASEVNAIMNAARKAYSQLITDLTANAVPTAEELHKFNTFTDREFDEWLTSALNAQAGHATGAKRIKHSETAWTQEKGAELIIRPSDGAILTPLKTNDAVIPANLTENLFKWGAINPDSFAVNPFMGKWGDTAGSNNSNDVLSNNTANQSIDMHFDSLIRVDGNVDADVADRLEDLVKGLTKNKEFQQNVINFVTKDFVRESRKQGFR